MIAQNLNLYSSFTTRTKIFFLTAQFGPANTVHFAPVRGVHFAPASTVELKSAKGVQFNRIFQSCIDKINSNISHIGIDLSLFGERIGNILIQFPIGLIKGIKRFNETDLEINWHEKFSRQESVKCVFTINSETRNELAIRDLEEGNKIVFTTRQYNQRVKLSDTSTDLIFLSSFNGKGFQMDFSVTSLITEGIRTFSDKTPELEISKPPGVSRHTDYNDRFLSLIQERNLNNQLKENERILKHKQYYNRNNELKELVHPRAIGDLNSLIKSHGGRGVAIWDPFIDADIIISTIIKNHKTTAQVRIISSQKRFREITTLHKDISELQQKIIEASSNCFGLNLEFRCAYGVSMANFHDRFIIFPETEVEKKPRAWSLGISLNNFGMEHHILYEIDIAEYVLREFNYLWQNIQDPKYLIVKFESNLISQ